MTNSIRDFIALIIVLGSSFTYCSDFSSEDIAIAQALKQTPLAIKSKLKDTVQYPLLNLVLSYAVEQWKLIQEFENVIYILPNGREYYKKKLLPIEQSLFFDLVIIGSENKMLLLSKEYTWNPYEVSSWITSAIMDWPYISPYLPSQFRNARLIMRPNHNRVTRNGYVIGTESFTLCIDHLAHYSNAELNALLHDADKKCIIL